MKSEAAVVSNVRHCECSPFFFSFLGRGEGDLLRITCIVSLVRGGAGRGLTRDMKQRTTFSQTCLHGEKWQLRLSSETEQKWKIIFCKTMTVVMLFVDLWILERLPRVSDDGFESSLSSTFRYQTSKGLWKTAARITLEKQNPQQLCTKLSVRVVHFVFLVI